MGKRRSKGRSGPDTSKEGTPMNSDYDEAEPPSKKQKPKKGPKSSAELCRDLDIVDVELEYTDADYKNLTTYSFFTRMVRPQLTAANSRLPASKMTQILEAKWREFEESNPYKQGEEKEVQEEEMGDSSPGEDAPEEDEEESRQPSSEEDMSEDATPPPKTSKQQPASDDSELFDDEGSMEEESDSNKGGKKSRGKRGMARVYSEEEESITPRSRSRRSSPRGSNRGTEDEEMLSDDDDDDEEVEVRRSSSKKPKSRQSTGSLKIKLPITFGLRKSAREKTKSKAMTDREFENMLRSEEEEASDDSDSRGAKKGRGRPSKAKKKYKDSDDDSDFVTAKPKRKSGSSKRKSATPQTMSDYEASTQEDSSEDMSGEEIGDSDDSDYSGRHKRRSKKKKTPAKPEKPRIPGERKSSRKTPVVATSKKSTSPRGADLTEMTDREFEKMLREEEKERQQAKKEAAEKRREKEMEKKRQERKKKRQEQRENVKGKKGYWQAKEEEKKKEEGEKEKEKKKEKEKEGGESGNESDHFWYCEVCKDGGDLMLCDTCPKSYHQECIKLTIVPDGDWSCPKCTGEGLPEEGDSTDEDDLEEDGEEDSQHDQYCKVCKQGGDVILCDFCTCVYHLHCLNPPLKEVPEGDWKCPRCTVLENPPKAKIVRVLTWRWDQQLKGADETDHTHSPEKKAHIRKSLEEREAKREKKPERELFAKFEYHSFWDCEWIPEIELEVFQPMTWAHWRKHTDLDEPPALEDGSSFGKLRHKGGDKKEDDPHNMEERYYRYGIKPEWLTIQRIVCHDGKGKDLRYLVKWRDLPYQDCTWEFPSELPDGLQDWEKHVEMYNTRRKEKMKKQDEGKTRKKDMPKKSKWKKQIDAQPDYIEATGGKLHPYQLEGLNWLRFSYAQDTNTILADEMGLGKTIQSISFLYSLWKEGYCRDYPFIITAPLSTVTNWEREFEFWAPELYVVTYVGSKDNRAVLREREFCYKEGAFNSYARPGRLREGYKPKFDVLLTSYEMINFDHTTLASIEWGCMVIDEAHRLKNNQSLFFRTLMDYKIHYKLLLTGTPLQNNLEELFNLLNFLEPGKFDDMETFLNNFSEISRDEQVSKLHDMLAPHMLRRLKLDVLKDIPAKSEFIIRVELAPMQKKFYKHVLTKNYSALNVRGHSNVTSMVNIMMDLRKTCNHPYLFPSADTDAPLTKRGLYEGSALTKASGKMELLAKMLKVLKKDNHRVLIFSQMTRNLDLLEDFLDYHKYAYERIDGNIAGPKRQESIDRFNSLDSQSFVFLLSTRAGGLGINLATADTVVIYDMDWNPHNDIQAFSRAHRIGQKNKVMIFRFVSRNTVEEKIAQVCKKKMMLSELIVHKGMGSTGISATDKKESLSKQEISEILKYGAEDLFKDDDSGKLVYDDAMVEKILDRDQVSEIPETAEEAEVNTGMNEYLRSFKVATYTLKEGEEEEEEEEEEEPTPGPSTAEDAEAIMEATSLRSKKSGKKATETDQQYWDRVLRDSYTEHVAVILQEQEAIAKTLGKGKRVRKQINYKERELGHAMEIEAKTIKKPQKGDVKYMSDYEPSSAEESESEEEAGNEDVEALEGDARKAYEEKQKLRQKQKEIKKKQQQAKRAIELPPLLSKLGPNTIEVLGFTARQRRAFLDAVMRYGMPPEDAYKSQWLLRDLRLKPERVFKAYVSLFMRHLCEPVPDRAETFADGVPREGLSRQHVLTRIGIIALIRRKVQEYEGMHGTESMERYAPKEIPKPIELNGEESEEKTVEKGDGESKPAEDKEEEKKEGKMEGDGEKVEGNSEKKEGEEDMETEEGKDGGEKEGDKKEKSEEKEDNMEKGDAEEGDKKEAVEEEKMDAVDDGEKTKEDKATKTETADEAMVTESDEKGGKDEGEKKEEKGIEDGKQEDVKKTEDEDKIKDQKGEEQDKKEKEESDKTEDVKNNDQEKKTEDKKEQSRTPPLKSKELSQMSPAELAAHFRQAFWIADGGFTELHAIWTLEERSLVAGQEPKHWHRVHDFWLLAGVITHGYRHWQDILYDTRFELLNHAFQTDQEKSRKAAFLNRRFQLLEQALVIEEQLRKASAENEFPFKANEESRADSPSDIDRLAEVDRLADNLKKLGKGSGPPPDPKLHKVLNQVATLVSDIKSATYSGMPATMVRAPPSVPTVRHTMVPSDKPIELD